MSKAIHTADSEAEAMLRMHGDSPGALPACLKTLSEQMNVIQSRSQLLLTLATLTFTITGFSGPNIARTSPFAREAIILGLALVLLATVGILLGSLRVRWVTQMVGDDARATLRAVLEYRNQKTKFYRAELILIVVGLASYVSSVIAYLLSLP